MNERDRVLIKYINKHYSELIQEIEGLVSVEDFKENKTLNKAIKMDILQLGELVNQLSLESKQQIQKKDLIGVIDFRNQVAHGYISLKEDVVWETIQNDIPRIISQLNLIK